MIHHFLRGVQKSGVDPYFSSVSLLLHCDGTNGSTTFTDSSNNALTVTPSGNAAISTVQSKFSGASALFDGTGDKLVVTANYVLSMGTGDFTYELWMYKTAASVNNTIIDHNYSSAPNFTLQAGGSNYRQWILYAGGGSFFTESTEHSLNTWHHYAIVRNGSGTNNLVMYRDGVNVGQATYTGEVGNSSVNLTIGWSGAGGGTDYSGYIDELRITKGVARYTGNFTPPNAPF